MQQFQLEMTTIIHKAKILIKHIFRAIIEYIDEGQVLENGATAQEWLVYGIFRFSCAIRYLTFFHKLQNTANFYFELNLLMILL